MMKQNTFWNEIRAQIQYMDRDALANAIAWEQTHEMHSSLQKSGDPDWPQEDKDTFFDTVYARHLTYEKRDLEKICLRLVQKNNRYPCVGDTLTIDRKGVYVLPLPKPADTPKITIEDVLKAIPTVKPFLSESQLDVMGRACRGPDRQFFKQKFVDLANQIANMPVTYDQAQLGDEAMVHLHYFQNGSDWYITEKDVDGGIRQATGYTILNGNDHFAELGYVSIEELTKHGAELDLHFTPCTLGEIKAQRQSGGTAPEIRPTARP